MSYADFKCLKCGHLEPDVDVGLSADPQNPIFKECPKCAATAESGEWYDKTFSDSIMGLME